MNRTLLIVLIVGSITGCAPQEFEPEPVMVDTQYGSIACRFYTQSGNPGGVSLAHPSEMTKETADSICMNVAQGILEWNDI